MPVNYFRADDSNAPKLVANKKGSFLEVLQACLVDGYNQSTITSSVKEGDFLRITFNENNSYRKYQKVVISGAGDIDGIHVILETGHKTIKIAYTGSNTPSAGTFKVAPLGWTRPFHDAARNVSVFKNGDSTHPLWVRIEDNGRSFASHSIVDVKTYKNMTTIDSGENPLPYDGLPERDRITVKSIHNNNQISFWGLVGDKRHFQWFTYVSNLQNIETNYSSDFPVSTIIGAYKDKNGSFKNGVFTPYLSNNINYFDNHIGSSIATIKSMYIHDSDVVYGFLNSDLNPYPFTNETFNSSYKLCSGSFFGTYTDSTRLDLLPVNVGNLYQRNIVGTIPGVFHTNNTLMSIDYLIFDPIDIKYQDKPLLAVRVKSSNITTGGYNTKLGMVFYHLVDGDWE